MVLPVARLLETLEQLAPLSLAGDWDNVGVLVEGAKGDIHHCVLCIDLTLGVLSEARSIVGDERGGLVIAYHPPIFEPLRSLSTRRPNEAVALAAARSGLHVYSPHTALDAVPGGVCDWIGLAFPEIRSARPLEAAVDTGSTEQGKIPAMEAFAKLPLTGAGQGRLFELSSGMTLADLCRALSGQFGIPDCRVARADRHAGDAEIRTVAVCPGAGASVLMGSDAEVYVTGEMRHHDVLAARETGHSVILSEHTHTERGYLPLLGTRLEALLGSELDVHVSTRDRDPLSSANTSA